MPLLKISDERFEVTSEKECFIILTADEHTKQMLTDFQKDQIQLELFEGLMGKYGASEAYFRYNGLPIPVEKTQEEIVEEKAQKVADLFASGDIKGAVYAMDGIEKPKSDEPKIKS